MRVLFAVNLTEPRHVIRTVENLCERMDADLYVLHVGAPTAADLSRLGDAGLMNVYDHHADVDDDPEGGLSVERRATFDDFVRRSFRLQVKPMLHESVDPSLAISQVVERIGADMLVIGERPHAFLERIVGGGSFSSRVLKTVEVPTLLVPIR